VIGIDLGGHRAIITGAAAGIGAATSHALRDAGAYVIGIDVAPFDGDRPDQVVDGDVTDPGVRRRALDLLGAACDRAVLVNNAGLQREERLSQTTLEDAERLVAVNVTATWRMTVEFAERGHRGSIINIASVLGLSGDPALGVYSVTKGAVVNLTRTSALEYAGRLRVNAVCPGAIRTSLTTRAWAASGDAHGAERRMSAIYPVGRIGEPAEVAPVVAFLASDLAAFVNGALWTVDGGLLAANAEWGLERL
jgi:NAD(P)-dependent dehydrogenase (short-subunit alcohol dehydrogenase family)